MTDGKPIPVFGDGTAARDFTYVDDIANGTILSLKPMGYQVINLGSDSPVSVNYCISLIEKHLDQLAHKIYLPSHTADVRHTWANVTKATESLGWFPKTTLNDGIRETVKWYIENQYWAKTITID